MNKEIGGYFGLELSERISHYHKDALRLNTARNCFEYILRLKQYKKVFIPFYTCDVILEPLKRLNIGYEFYHINEDFEPLFDKTLKRDEAILYTNYFGICRKIVLKLIAKYSNQIIIDNSQAFFEKRIDNIDTFYSPRKFFGVADGGYLYTDALLEMEFEYDVSYKRMSHLLKRIDISASFGYSDFKENDNILSNQPIKFMSKITDQILQSIDYKKCINKRKSNFAFVHSLLSSENGINIHIVEDQIPMVYPFLSPNGEKIKKKLIENNIFVPTYWENSKNKSINAVEKTLINQIVALPIDHRYSSLDISKYISLCQK